MSDYPEIDDDDEPFEKDHNPGDGDMEGGW